MEDSSVKIEDQINMIDVCIVEELNKSAPDTVLITKWSSELEELQAQLAISPDDTGAVSEGTDASSSHQEDAMSNKLNAQDLGLESTPAPSPEPVGTLSAADLGLGADAKAEKIFNSLSVEAIGDVIVPVPGSDGQWAALIGPNAIADKAHMVKLNAVSQRSEIKKAARGLALSLVGAVQEDESVLGTTGQVYRQSNGQCTTTKTDNIHTFGGNIESVHTVPCAGLAQYKFDGKKPVATSKEDTRCLHMWAVEHELGYYAVFQTTNAKTGKDNELVKACAVAMSEVAGNEDARKQAAAQVAEWSANRQTSRAGWSAVSETLNDARNKGEVTPEGTLPDRPDALNLLVGNTGRTIQQTVQEDGRGRQFLVNYIMPLAHGDVSGRVRSINLGAFAYNIAPQMSTVERKGPEGSILKVENVVFL